MMILFDMLEIVDKSLWDNKIVVIKQKQKSFQIFFSTQTPIIDWAWKRHES